MLSGRIVIVMTGIDQNIQSNILISTKSQQYDTRSGFCKCMSSERVSLSQQQQKMKRR